MSSRTSSGASSDMPHTSIAVHMARTNVPGSPDAALAVARTCERPSGFPSRGLVFRVLTSSEASVDEWNVDGIAVTDSCPSGVCGSSLLVEHRYDQYQVQFPVS